MKVNGLSKYNLRYLAIFIIGVLLCVFTSKAILWYSGTLVKEGQWIEVNGLPEPRYAVVVGVLNNALYVMGGLHDDKDNRAGDRTNVYYYDGSNWIETIGLPESCAGGASGSLSNILYLAAQRFRNRVYCFDGLIWREVMSLPTKSKISAERNNLAIATFNNELYSIGGVGGMLVQSNVYCFNGERWREVASLPEARYALGAGVFNNKLYVVGGGKKQNEYYYDGTNWNKSPVFPGYRHNVKACVLEDGLYAMSYGGCKTNATPVYRFDGKKWKEVASVPINT